MAFGVWVLYRLASVVLVLTLAALFAYVIAPLVHVAERPVRIGGRRRHLPEDRHRRRVPGTRRRCYGGGAASVAERERAGA
jgi:hypothetical protein